MKLQGGSHLNLNTQEAEAGSLSSRPASSTDQFQDSQDYTEKPCLKKQNKTNKKKEPFWDPFSVRCEQASPHPHLPAELESSFCLSVTQSHTHDSAVDSVTEHLVIRT